MKKVLFYEHQCELNEIFQRYLKQTTGEFLWNKSSFHVIHEQIKAWPRLWSFFVLHCQSREKKRRKILEESLLKTAMSLSTLRILFLLPSSTVFASSIFSSFYIPCVSDLRHPWKNLIMLGKYWKKLNLKKIYFKKFFFINFNWHGLLVSEKIKK